MNISFAVPKKAMEDAVKLLDIVPTRNGISSSEFVKVESKEKKRLHMSLSSDLSGEASVRVLKVTEKVEKPLFLDRRMLFPFINAGVDLQVPLYEFSLDGTTVIVRHGTRKSVLENNETASGYESTPDFTKSIHVEINEEWASIANCATLCACFDPTIPSLNCVHVLPEKDYVKIRASDTKLIFQGILALKSFPCTEPICLPLDLIASLNLFTNGICYYSSKWAMLQFSIGRLWQSVKVECRKSFPYTSLNTVVEEVVTKGDIVLKLGSQSLVEASDRIANYMNSVTKDNPVLRLYARQDKKVAHLFSSTIGASFDETVALASLAKKDCEIEWPLISVLPIMRHCKNIGTVRILKDSVERTCLKAGNIVLVVSKVEKKKKRGK